MTSTLIHESYLLYSRTKISKKMDDIANKNNLSMIHIKDELCRSNQSLLVFKKEGI